MRSLLEIQKAITAHKQARPEPPGGWVSKLGPMAYTAYMKTLDAWRDGLSHLEMELAIAERAHVVVFITPPIPEVQPEPKRAHPKPPSPEKLEPVTVLLSDLEAREQALVSAYRPGDRGAYMQIRNLRAGINMRRERYGLPCLHFSPLPRGQAARRPHSHRKSA